MCSKKWAKPDLPGSTSLRDPVCTGICSETMFGKPVGTTITFRPFGSVFSVALNGRMSRAAGCAALAVVAFFCCAMRLPEKKVRRIAVRMRKRLMKTPPRGEKAQTLQCRIARLERNGVAKRGIPAVSRLVRMEACQKENEA